MPDEIQTSLSSTNEIFRQQDALRNTFQKETVPVNVHRPQTLEELEQSFFGQQSRQAEPPPAPQQPITHPAVKKTMTPRLEQPDQFLESCESNPKPVASVITEKQLQALSKKHLLLMILDLQEKLEMIVEEHEKLLQAFHIGCAHGQQQE